MGAPRAHRRTGQRTTAKGKRGRCPTGKTRFRHEADALAAARRRSEATGVELWVYECGRCKGWHRTSQSPQAYAEAAGITWATGSGN